MGASHIMEITKGITTTKNAFHKSSDFCLFHQSPKAIMRRLLALKFSKLGEYVTTKKIHKSDFYHKRYDEKYFRSVNCYSCLTRHTYVKFSQRDIDHEITLKILEFILNSIEKVKLSFLLSAMYMFSESNGTKS